MIPGSESWWRSVLKNSKTKEKNMENRMGHFVSWKFGVPVKVWEADYSEEKFGGRLVWEDDSGFRVITESGNFAYCRKTSYIYELIPYKYKSFSPRYPVCQSSDWTAFCNSGGQMIMLDVGAVNMERYPEKIVTLTVDGKIIELSAETVAELKKKLGI